MPEGRETHPRTYAIREVVQLLAAEFEISESNLRFWEKEGLLAPKRTKGGHRLFSEADLAQIRLIYKLKNERYFPLPMIKQLVASGMPAAEIEAHVEKAAQAMLRPLRYDPDYSPCSLDELSERSGMALSVLERMVEAGILPRHEAPRYDEDDLRIVELFSPVFEAGFAPEDFRAYLAAIEHLAHEEAALMRKKTLRFPDRRQECKWAAIVDELPRYLFRKARLRMLKELHDAGYFEEKLKRFREIQQAKKGTDRET